MCPHDDEEIRVISHYTKKDRKALRRIFKILPQARAIACMGCSLDLPPSEWPDEDPQGHDPKAPYQGFGDWKNPAHTRRTLADLKNLPLVGINLGPAKLFALDNDGVLFPSDIARPFPGRGESIPSRGGEHILHRQGKGRFRDPKWKHGNGQGETRSSGYIVIWQPVRFLEALERVLTYEPVDYSELEAIKRSKSGGGNFRLQKLHPKHIVAELRAADSGWREIGLRGSLNLVREGYSEEEITAALLGACDPDHPEAEKWAVDVESFVSTAFEKVEESEIEEAKQKRDAIWSADELADELHETGQTHDLLWNADTNEWLHWTPLGWRVDPKAIKLFRKVIRREGRNRLRVPTPSSSRPDPKSGGSGSFANDVLDALTGNEGIGTRESDWDHPESGVLGLPDGYVLDLATLEARKITRDDLIRKALRVIPAATMDCEEGRELRRFLAETIPEPETLRYFLTLVGRDLIGDLESRTRHELFVIYGAPRSGKSLLMTLIVSALGDYGTWLEPWIVLQADSTPTGYAWENEVGKLKGIRFAAQETPSRGRDGTTGRTSSRLRAIPWPGAESITRGSASTATSGSVSG